MRAFIVSLILFIIPCFASAAGGYVMPLWLSCVMVFLLIPFPILFFYIGILCFRAVPQHKKYFIGLYAIDLLLVAAAMLSAEYLVTHENPPWLEVFCLLSAFSIPIFTAFISYKLNSAADAKYEKILNRFWRVFLYSFSVIFLLPFTLMFLEFLVGN